MAHGMSFYVSMFHQSATFNIGCITYNLYSDLIDGGVSYPIHRASQEEYMEPLSPHNRKVLSSITLILTFNTSCTYSMFVLNILGSFWPSTCLLGLCV